MNVLYLNHYREKERKLVYLHLREVNSIYQEAKANILSAILVRQIGHSEQASEQDLHTAK